MQTAEMTKGCEHAKVPVFGLSPECGRVILVGLYCVFNCLGLPVMQSRKESVQ